MPDLRSRESHPSPQRSVESRQPPRSSRQRRSSRRCTRCGLGRNQRLRSVAQLEPPPGSSTRSSRRLGARTCSPTGGPRGDARTRRREPGRAPRGDARTADGHRLSPLVEQDVLLMAGRADHHVPCHSSTTRSPPSPTHGRSPHACSRKPNMHKTTSRSATSVWRCA
jgi:hypothetical protein